MSRKLLALAVALSAAPSSRAAVLHVPADHATIQAAIDAAAAGDTVLVAPGTYPENLDFRGKAIAVQSEAGPEVTIVDARRLGAAVRFQTAEGPGAVLAGFTLRNGRTDMDGGCVAISGASPTISGNHVFGCESTIGGGGIGLRSSSASIRGNVIVGNRATYLGGGGIEVVAAASAEIVGNLVADNVSDMDGGGISLWAGGTPLVSGNVILANAAAGAGGGIATVNWSDADVVQNAIVGNSARTGGGVSLSVPSGERGALLVANTIAGNVAREGSALYASGFTASVVVVNDVLASPDATAAVHCDFGWSSAGPTFDHVLADAVGGGAYAVCPDPTGTSGNVAGAPAFADPAAGDYRLGASSPAIDAGLATAPLLPARDLAGGPRVSGAAVDIGAWEYPGTGVTISPARVDFGTVAPGDAVAATVSLANGGASGVTVGPVAVSPPFAVTGATCGGSLAAGARCAIEVSYAPPALGAHHGVVTPTIDGARAAFPVVLAGQGAAADLAFAPAELRFQDVPLGRQSAPAAVTISNPNASAVALDGLALTGAREPFAQTNDCPGSLAPGASCNATVTCTPAADGWYVAALVPTGPFIASQGVALVCSGIQPITPDVGVSPSAVTVRPGGSAQFLAQIARGDWLSQALAMTCSTDAPASACTVDPASLPAGSGGASATIRVETRAGWWLARAPARGGSDAAPALGLALLVVGTTRFARGRARLLVVLAALTSLSCLGDQRAPRTPPGT